jgi:TRAP-type uncharacterized transport system substrate-binding protein
MNPMQTPHPNDRRSSDWRGWGPLRVMLIVLAAMAVTALASFFGISRDYGYLHASLLTGSAGGAYHALGERLAERAGHGRGNLAVVATAGSVDNVSRLVESRKLCTPAFAFVQDGTTVPAGAALELLGQLPDRESLLLLGKRDRNFSTFADLRGAAIGIGPEGSGTAYLMRKLFDDPDLKELGIRLVPHELAEQAELVAQGRLDLAAVVMAEDAKFVQDAIRRNNLDIATPRELEGMVKRHPWLELGRIPAGLYDVERPTPAVDKFVARVDTLVLVGPCARRADRVALLALLSEELPGFVRSNPPKSTDSGIVLPLAAEARQFFVTGEPELADRYFPWLVNLMSPVYWVYLVMAVTILFNAMRGFSRFRLWRIDAAREKLKSRISELAGREPIAGVPSIDPSNRLSADEKVREAIRDIKERLAELRARCQKYTGSFVTPMGDEMFYRYQEALIDDLSAALAAIPSPAGRDENVAGSSAATAT